MTAKQRSKRGKAPLAAVPSDTSVTQGSTVDEARSKYYGEKLVQYAASGVPVAQGAQLLELPLTTAKRYYAKALEGLDGMSDEAKREIVQLDLETLRMLQQAHMPRAMKGSIGSAQVVIAAMRERANRLGLDEALKVQISNSAIGDAVEDVVQIIEQAAPIELPPLPALPPLPGEEGAAG